MPSNSSLQLVIGVFVLSSFVLVNPVLGQSASKPSVPQFSIKLVKHTFDLPALTSTDPFTGQPTTQPSQHWEWLTVDIIINNQNFNGKANDSFNNYQGLMYNVRFKGHFSND